MFRSLWTKQSSARIFRIDVIFENNAIHERINSVHVISCCTVIVCAIVEHRHTIEFQLVIGSVAQKDRRFIGASGIDRNRLIIHRTGNRRRKTRNRRCHQHIIGICIKVRNTRTHQGLKSWNARTSTWTTGSSYGSC